MIGRRTVPAFVIATLAVGVGSAHAASSPTTTPTTAKPAAVTTTKVPAKEALPSGVKMVPVPKGNYTVGSDKPSDEAVSKRTLAVNAFFIDTFEVSNADYAKFVDAVGAPTPGGWVRGAIPTGKDDHPVIGMGFDWATTYCAALGKRLPGDAEWEAAARGSDGRLYPWGANAALVDLDTPGSKAVGSVAANVSPFGVHDTVGSAWEWVAQPYTAVGSNQVRRGGEYGRVREGAAMRQAVDPTNESVIAETGFRCAAIAVDPARAAGQFAQTHEVPAIVSTTPLAPTTTVAPGVLLRDNFENPKSGWPTIKDSTYFVGYHAPSWYHVDASMPGVQALSLLGVEYSDVSIVAHTFVDKTGTTTGRFRYGLAFRASGPVSSPPPGVKGPQRPEDFYAFVIDPRGGRWYLLHADTLPFRVLTGGRVRGLTGLDPTKPDTLRVDAFGRHLSLFINGRRVGGYDTRRYHPTGDIGFFVETLDEKRAHVHFADVEVTRQKG